MAMLSQILLRFVPFWSCMFVAFFGNLIAHVVRAFAVFWSATAPALLPALLPYMETGEMNLTPDNFLQILGAVFAGGLAMFVSVKNRNFGMRVQSMSVGAFVVASTMPMITGKIRQEAPMVMPQIEWIMLALSGITGIVFGFLGIKFEGAVNILSTSMIGIYGALQTVASLDFPFTRGLSVADGDQRGCTSDACFVTMGVTAFIFICSIYNQIKFKSIPTTEVPDDAGQARKCVLRLYNVIFTLLEPIFVMNKSLEEMGNALSPDAMAAEQNVAPMACYQVLSFAASVCTITFAVSFMVSTIELFISGVYTHAGPMMTLGSILLCVSVGVVLGTGFGAMAFTMPPDSDGRRLRLKIYLATAMLGAPVTGCCSLLCFALSSREYLNLPWVQEFTGVDLTVLADSFLQERELVLGSHVANSTNSTSSSSMGQQMNVQMGGIALTTEQMEQNEALQRILLELPSSGICMMYTTIGLASVVVLVGKALGGFRFVAVVLCTFTAMLNLVNGLGIGVVGWALATENDGVIKALGQNIAAGESANVSDAKSDMAQLSAEAKADLANFGSTQASLLNGVLLVASFMVAQAGLGMIGAKMADNAIGRTLLKLYGLSLLIVLMILIGIVVATGYYGGMGNTVKPHQSGLPNVCCAYRQ